MAALLTTIDKWLLRLDMLLLTIAAIAIMAMMLITTTDVIMRYVMQAPIRWAFTFITSYVLTAAFWLGFSYAMQVGHHISVDYFVRRMPVGIHRAGLVFGYGCGAAIFGAIATFGAADACKAWLSGEVLFGDILWPVWLYKIIIPIGMFPLALRCVLRTVECIAAWEQTEGRLAEQKVQDESVIGERL